MCYLVAKDINKEGSILLKTKHGKELVDFKHELISLVGNDRIQLVTISRPSAYGEYEPYKLVSDKEEFKASVLAL
ncbi:MAG: hypothetical protein IJI46_03860 [Erysipelotrichaceae bacterium]|nr:hypothetical protein [Erysipelotrichaceae bacterium]